MFPVTPIVVPVVLRLTHPFRLEKDQEIRLGGFTENTSSLPAVILQKTLCLLRKGLFYTQAQDPGSNSKPPAQLINTPFFLYCVSPTAVHAVKQEKRDSGKH